VKCLKAPGALPSIGRVLVKRNRKSVTVLTYGRMAFLAAALALVLAACDGGGTGNPTPAESADESTPVGLSPVVPAATPPTAPLVSLEEAEQLLRDGLFEEAAVAFRANAAAASSPAIEAEGRLGAAVALFEAGERSASIDELRLAAKKAEPGSPTHRRSSYLLALRLNDTGDHAAAAAAVQGLASTLAGDALQPYIVAEYARALGHDGRAAPAIETWNQLLTSEATPVKVRAMAYRELAALAKDANDGPAELKWLELQLATQEDATTHREAALVAREVGDMETFAAHLRRIVARYPASELAETAIEELREAGFDVPPGDEGLVRYRHRDYAEAQRILAEATAMVEGKAPAELAFEAFYLGAAYEDGGAPVEAIAAYDAAVAHDPTSDYAHRAKYWAARVMEEIGDAPSASARYSELATEGPAGEFSSEAAFRAGHTLLAAGDPAGAVAAWEQFGTNADASILYWKGRAFEELGDEEPAMAAYEAAIAAGPIDFYGEESARRLGRLGSVDVGYVSLPSVGERDWASVEGWLFERVGGVPTPLESTPARDFLALGLRSEAIAVLRAAADGDDPWQVLQVMRETDDLGLPDVAAQLAVRLRHLAGVRSDEVPKALLQVAYPLAYSELLDRVAKANGLDPLFVAAMVRQESFWDRNAGSHAGALGLTQVIPPTGEAIAESLGHPDFKPDDLFRPAVSLEFGAYYLAGQLERWGDPYRALAGYNAGPGNVMRWNEQVDGPSPADWVAAVDITETKGYVVYVMEHYAHYRQAWR